VAWSAGQLEAEIQKSSWLQTDADLDLVFSSDLSNMWKKALKKIGVDPALLSSQTGHA
jgi:putative transcriptional regulator